MRGQRGGGIGLEGNSEIGLGGRSNFSLWYGGCKERTFSPHVAQNPKGRFSVDQVSDRITIVQGLIW